MVVRRFGSAPAAINRRMQTGRLSSIAARWIGTKDELGEIGSLMSTPILNPPQSAILGMHKIQKRAVVIDDQIVIRPMMYLALSYDHRIIDGREAVSFLARVKEMVEDPRRLLMGV